MNQEKIGKFIAKMRKEKKLTQQELAEKLGVSDRTIGNWENGRNMPDLSLFKPLCEELNISINDLLSGEKLKKEKYQEKFEENVINTIDYSNKKIKLSKDHIYSLLMIFGLFISITALTMFSADSSWSCIYSLVGIIMFIIGLGLKTKKLGLIKQSIIIIMTIIFSISILLISDYYNVKNNNQPPRFTYLKSYGENIIEYRTIFYDVYRINVNTKNEYYVIDTSKKYTDNDVPIVPFNRNKSGIDNIIKYKNKYIGNNSNDGNLISSLPLSEYGYVFEIDSEDFGLKINYQITDWYINNNFYIEKSLLYNSVAIFSLIDNVSYIEYNFSGNSYKITRGNLINNFSEYNKINNNGIDKNNFNNYLEKNINNNDFVLKIFSDSFEK